MAEPREPAPTGRADARRNRERILEAAADVLGADPSAGLPEIAEAAGVSRATVYRHFADVGEIRAAFVAEAREIGRTVLQDFLPTFLERKPGMTTDELVGIVREVLPLQHRWTRLIAGEPLPDAPLIDAFAPTVRAIIRRGQQQGEFRGDLDLDLVADALMTLALLAVRKVHAEGVPPDRAAEMLRVYFEGLRPSGRR
ncbi:MAG: TetR/AcrR family transcriptional regulator [Solirubrobacteraceae bacterium]|nr:TetR/AcrR family transcriptional regulator [Solirubrobacteraceae bacterium]